MFLCSCTSQHKQAAPPAPRDAVLRGQCYEGFVPDQPSSQDVGEADGGVGDAGTDAGPRGTLQRLSGAQLSICWWRFRSRTQPRRDHDALQTRQV